MQGALKNTEDEVIDLRREVEALKTKLDAAKQAIPTKKRKKVDDETIPYPRSPKKPKPDVKSSKIGSLPILDSSTEADFAQAGEIGNNLLRSLFHLHAILKSHIKIEPLELTYHLVRACEAIPQLVLDEVQTLVGSDAKDGNDMKQVLLLARRSVTSIIVAFNRISHVSNDTCSESKATYAFILMFKKLLTGLQLLSEAEARAAFAAEVAAKKSAADKSKGKGKTPRVLNIKESPTLILYTTFLTGIMDMLDPKNEANRALFEGLAFCVLESLGSRMYHSVFGHTRGESIEAEILQSHSRDDTSDSEPSPSSDQQNNLKQLRLEAPYLITLMDRVMAAAPSFLGAATSAKTGKPKNAHSRASMKGALAIEAKDCLQRTLVTCMFGGDDGMSSDPFAECLKMPVDKGPISIPKVKEADVQDWFKEELWRLLGWEILSKEGDW